MKCDARYALCVTDGRGAANYNVNEYINCIYLVCGKNSRSTICSLANHGHGRGERIHGLFEALVRHSSDVGVGVPSLELWKRRIQRRDCSFLEGTLQTTDSTNASIKG